MIELEGISKSFDGRRFVVEAMTLEARRGELVVLIGASGCGKTTVLKMVNRLVEPSGGRIRVDGKDTCEVDPVTLRRAIGYVIQTGGLFPHLTVAQNIATVPRLLGWTREQISSRVAELTELINLPGSEFANRYPHTLSGGQRQRVGFARALAGFPKVMLLDEPFGALDPITRDALQTDFKSIQRRLGFTALMVTHDMSEALLLGDRIAVMEAGRIDRLGTPRELLTNPGSDYVAKLLEVPMRHANRLGTIAGTGVSA